MSFKSHFKRVDRFLKKFDWLGKKTSGLMKDLWEVISYAPIETWTNNALPLGLFFLGQGLFGEGED